MVLVLLSLVGSLSLVAEGRRARLEWSELPAETAAAPVASRHSAAEPPAAAPVAAPAAPPVRRPAGARTEKPPGGAALDLNRATARELEALPGIGPALARRILAYRESEGPFHTVEDLRKVAGIGPARLSRLAGMVRAGEEPVAAR